MMKSLREESEEKAKERIGNTGMRPIAIRIAAERMPGRESAPAERAGRFNVN